MPSFFIQELIKAAFGFASSTFSSMVSEKNKARLEKKQKSLKSKKVDPEEISKIVLNVDETIKGEFIVTQDETFSKLSNHIKEIERWASIIGFRDLREDKQLHSVYIELDTYLMPINTHISEKEKSYVKPLQNAVFDTNNHCIILGQPGAGKTTSLKKVCTQILENSSSTSTFANNIPILLRFRDLNSNFSERPIFNHLLSIFPLKFQFKNNGDGDSKLQKDELEHITDKTVYSFINHIKPVIILDGFDEISTHSGKEIVVNEVRSLANKLDDVKIILSSRSGEFSYKIDNSSTFEIAPLTSDQISEFVHKWLNNKEEAKKFLSDVKTSPFSDTSIKPLSLAHLCAIYERIGQIPDRPKTVYRKVVNLLLEEWDEQRSIKRASAFMEFQSDRKFEFLTHLAFYFTTKIKTSTFSREQLISAYMYCCKNFNLPQNQVSEVVNEIESHSGLLLEAGYEKYEFVHKSLQEYLTAEYLVKLPSFSNVKNEFQFLGAELAIATSISSNPSLFFIETILNYFSQLNLPTSFYDSFISRLIQENPDFYKEELIVISSCVLLSLWINKGNSSGKTRINWDFPIQKENTYNELVKKLLVKNDLKEFLKYYKIDKAQTNSSLVKLERKSIIKDYKIPATLFLPANFISKIQNN